MASDSAQALAIRRAEPADSAPAGDAAYTGIMVQIAAECRTCGGGVPLNRIGDAVRCPRCRAKHTLPQAFWERILARAVGESLSMPEGRGRSTRIESTPPVWLLYGRRTASCERCKSAYPIDALEQLLGAGCGELFCPECGAPAAVRAAPEWIKGVHPASAMIVGEAPAAELTAPQGGLHRWFLLLSLRGSLGPMPLEARTFCDFGVEPWGRLVIAWHDKDRDARGSASRVGCVDRHGMLAWCSHEPALSTSVELLASPPEGTIVVVDAIRGRVTHLDPRTGRVAAVMARPEERAEPDALEVRDHQGVSIDVDGTFVVRRIWADDACGLRRFGRDGMRRPLWFGMSFEQEEQALRRGRAVRWQALPERPVRLPPESMFTFGWNGDLYVGDPGSGTIARYAPDGTLVHVWRPGGDAPIRRLRSMSADRQGRLVMLYTDSRPRGASYYDHLAWLHPNGRFEPWLGVHVPGSPRLLGTDAGRVKTLPDGRVFVGGSLAQLREFRPGGLVAWESPLAQLEEHALRQAFYRTKA